jgi:hypothetical protein
MNYGGAILLRLFLHKNYRQKTKQDKRDKSAVFADNGNFILLFAKYKER